MGMTLAESEAQIRYGLANGKRLMIDKASLATQIAGGMASLWRATGVPGQGAIPGAWAICAAGLLGSMTLANPVAPDENYLAWGWAVCQNAGYAPIIADRLGHSGNLSGTVTTAQAVNADLTVATSNLQVRKGDADYSDVNWYLEWYTATGFGVAQLAIRGYLGAILAPATTSAAGEQILPTIMGSVSITLAGATLLAFGRRVYPLVPGARVSDALARKTAEANPRLAARANAAIRTVTARPGRAIAYAKKRG